MKVLLMQSYVKAIATYETDPSVIKNIPPEKIYILPKIVRLYEKRTHQFSPSVVIQGKTIDDRYQSHPTDYHCENFTNKPRCVEKTIAAPYDFCQQQSLYVYCNHANRVLGGGIFSRGFVQEEQLLLKTTILFPLYDKICNHHDAAGLLGTNLDVQPLLISTNIFIYQNPELKLYGADGMKKINDNIAILDNFYLVHRTSPRIYILCKAIPPLTVPYRDAYFQNKKLSKWIYLYAYHSYCFTISELNQNPEIDTINICEGNWGCGVYNHNVNTIYVLTHLAMRAACQLLALTVTKPINFFYYTYDSRTLALLKPAKQFLLDHVNQSVQECLDHIDLFHNIGYHEWCQKL